MIFLSEYITFVYISTLKHIVFFYIKFKKYGLYKYFFIFFIIYVTYYENLMTEISKWQSSSHIARLCLNSAEKPKGVIANYSSNYYCCGHANL